MHTIKSGMFAAGLGWLAIGGLTHAQEPAPAAPSAPSQNTGADLSKTDLPGPIDNIQDLEDTGKILFKVADTNNDGQISQKEAIDAGNLMVGGVLIACTS